MKQGQNRQNDDIDGKIARKKPSKRLLLTIAWLKEHDPDERLSREAVAEATGFSTGTVSNARRTIRTEIGDV